MENICFVIEDELRKYRPMFEKMCPPPMMVKRGMDLCVQCHTSGWMYYLVEGIARVYVTNYDGNERVIDFMKKDTLLGMDCITPNSKSIVSISALTDIQVLPFSVSMLKEMMACNPDFAYDLVLYYGKILRQVTYNSACLGITNLKARLANFLLLFVDTLEYRKAGKIVISQEDIAAAINLSRAQVAKMLGEFRREGIIQTGNRNLMILNLDGLKKYCQL